MLRRDETGLRDNASEAKEIGSIVEKYSGGPARLTSIEGTADFIASELKAESSRDEIIDKAGDEINRIDPDKEEHLVDRARLLAPEIGQPLMRSAAKLDLELDSGKTKIASLNRLRIEQIKQLKKDQIITLTGNIIKLDKETGYGRLRPKASRSVLSFSIPRDIFFPAKQRFIDAYALSEVTVEALPYRDGIGNIARFNLLRIV